MRERIYIEGDTIEDPDFYCDVVSGLESKKYRPIIDPRNFDAPLTIKFRFRMRRKEIRYVEFSPDLEVSVEHTLKKAEAGPVLKKIKKDIEESIMTGNVVAEDFEAATLHMISRKNPVVVPKNEAERKLFENLESKKIFSKMRGLTCMQCGQTFMFPVNETNNIYNKKVFCKDCEIWFKANFSKETFVLNPEYMELITTVWDKIEKVIKTSWREVTKRGIPKIVPK